MTWQASIQESEQVGSLFAHLVAAEDQELLGSEVMDTRLGRSAELDEGVAELEGGHDRAVLETALEDAELDSAGALHIDRLVPIVLPVMQVADLL